MTDAELERAAATLGNKVVQRLDERRVARAVLARLATEPVVAAAASPLRRNWVLLLAAAAGVALVLRLSLTRPPAATEGRADTVPTLTVLHELDDLDAAELEVLLETLPPPAGTAAHPDPASFDDLDAKGLERLLRSLEG